MPLASAAPTEFADKTLTCAGCSKGFEWTVAEQQFFADKKLRNPPKRCRAGPFDRLRAPDPTPLLFRGGGGGGVDGGGPAFQQLVTSQQLFPKP